MWKFFLIFYHFTATEKSFLVDSQKSFTLPYYEAYPIWKYSCFYLETMEASPFFPQIDQITIYNLFRRYTWNRSTDTNFSHRVIFGIP